MWLTRLGRKRHCDSLPPVNTALGSQTLQEASCHVESLLKQSEGEAHVARN